MKFPFAWTRLEISANATENLNDQLWLLSWPICFTRITALIRFAGRAPATTSHVRLWPIADMRPRTAHVRFGG